MKEKTGTPSNLKSSGRNGRKEGMFPFSWHWADGDMWALSSDRWGKLPHSLRILGPGRPGVVYQRSDSLVGCNCPVGGWD